MCANRQTVGARDDSLPPRVATRVLILTWEYPPIVEGGLARHVRKLAENLVDAGVDVHVVTRGGGHLDAEEDRHGVTVHRVREPDYPKDDLDGFIRWVDHMNDDMRARGRGAVRAARTSTSCTRTTGSSPAPAQRLARDGRRAVARDRARDRARPPPGLGRQVAAVAHPRRRARDGAPRRPRDHVLALHAHARRRRLRDRRGAITAIPNGIDPRDLQPLGDLPRLRARFAAPDEKLVLLVGRLVYEKGFHLALDALSEVIEHVDGVRFLIAGSGTAEADLKAQARRLSSRATARSWAGSATTSCTRSTGSPTCAWCRRSTSRSGSSRSRRWRRAARASSPTPGGCGRSCRAGGSAFASARGTPRRSRA